jgi:DNA-binding MarR family transcriptional regulator
VAKLIESGLIGRSTDASDGRGVQLELSVRGRQLYRKMLPASIERNEAILGMLSARERQALEQMLDKLTRRVLDMLAEEKAYTSR